MKIINKVIGTLLVNFCVALVLFFLCDRAASMTYSIFSAFEDPENLRYEFIEYKSVNFVIATVLFSGFTRLIWQISLACKKTIPVFFAVLVTCGCALLAAAGADGPHRHHYYPRDPGLCFSDAAFRFYADRIFQRLCKAR